MKIAVVVCYDQQNYVRAYTLRKGLEAASEVEVINIANRRRGVLRYIEVPLKILKARIFSKPDAYLVTFRGYEMLLYMVLTLVRKPIIFDELINFTEWMDEHNVIKQGKWQYGLFRRWYAWLARKTRVILADTEAHAEYSAALNGMSMDKYAVIPVGSNEEVFAYRPDAQPAEPFTVFYYGSMLPLHGLSYVLDAAVQLKGVPGIQFQLVGGGDKAAKACQETSALGAHVAHQAWLPFEKLSKAASQAGLTIGGPFGDTLQSQFVVTGKTYQFMSLGMPVLIGQNKVNHAFVDKENCLIVPQASADDIAEAIRWAYSHREELKAIGQQGHKLYEKHFSQQVINRRVSQVVASLGK
jgi:glycosyltransferase involved in cell wall biosynthesis